MKDTEGKLGFTLVEMIAVLTIISLLIGLSLAVLPRLKGKGRQTATALEIARIGAALRTYYNDYGFYPPNTHIIDADGTVEPSDYDTYNRADASERTPPDSRGLARHLKYTAEMDGKAAYYEFDRSRLITVDHDSVPSTLEIPVRYLDLYGNEWWYVPFAEYEMVYAAEGTKRGISYFDELKQEERLWNPDSFQIRSAGPDRQFGTEDDITNFKR